MRWRYAATAAGTEVWQMSAWATFTYRQEGACSANGRALAQRRRLLPGVHRTARVIRRGPRRLVTGDTAELYYTAPLGVLVWAILSGIGRAALRLPIRPRVAEPGTGALTHLVGPCQQSRSVDASELVSVPSWTPQPRPLHDCLVRTCLEPDVDTCMGWPPTAEARPRGSAPSSVLANQPKEPNRRCQYAADTDLGLPFGAESRFVP